jgi:capsid protein
MGLKSAIRSLFSADRQRTQFADAACRPVQRSIKAHYDIAQTTDENSRHWQWADYFSADAALIPGVRRTARIRSRYEVANNSYAKGIVLTIANDTIGTGPRLQCHGDDRNASAEVEARWQEWSDAVRLARKLRTLVMARITDGESVALLQTNPRVQNPVKLDMRMIECDQLADPWIPWLTPNKIDGMTFDDFHDPLEYHILKYHPGGLYPMMTLEFDVYPSRYVMHLFRADRPQQSRGFPELGPALPLFAQLRRFTLATIAAAESIANHAAVIETNGPAVDTDSEAPAPYDLVELDRNSATVLPDGWRLNQPKPEQPPATYEMFKREILQEIARCLNVPYIIAAGSALGYNMASGRLDNGTYHKSLSIDRGEIGWQLDRVAAEWFAESSRVYGWDFPLPKHTWRWDRFPYTDPDADAKALLTRLSAGHSWATEMLEAGKDPDEEEASAAKYLGVNVDGFRALKRQRFFANQNVGMLPSEAGGEPQQTERIVEDK